MGSRTPFGHGQIQRGARGEGLIRAHRLSYQIHTGEVLTPDEKILHHCDVPYCVNPQHLYKGDQAQNMRDAYARNRKSRHWGKKGSEHHNYKITPEIVSLLRQDRLDGMTYRQIAANHDLSASHVHKLLR